MTTNSRSTGKRGRRLAPTALLGASWEWDAKTKPCHTCNQTGKQAIGLPCWRCGGTGKYQIAVLRALHVPPARRRPKMNTNDPAFDVWRTTPNDKLRERERK